MRERPVIRRIAGRPATATPARGRVGKILEASPFLDRVASSVVSSLVATFVVTWIASSIVIISAGGDGSALRWAQAGTWVLFFLLLGLSLACVLVLLLVLVDGRDPFTGWRGWAVRWAPPFGWLIAGASSAVLPERGAEALLACWLLTFPLCFVLPVMASIFGPDKSKNLIARAFRRTWRTIAVAGVLLSLCGLVQSGVALGATYVRSTT